MELKIKQLVAWIGGKARKSLCDMDTPVPVSIVGRIVRCEDDADYAPVRYGKRPKAAHAFGIETTHVSHEPFPLRLLLDIMNRAQVICEESWEDGIEKLSAAEQDAVREGKMDAPAGGYSISKMQSGKMAIRDILGVDYPELARFIGLTHYLWGDLEELRIAMIDGKKNSEVGSIVIVEADRPE